MLGKCEFCRVRRKNGSFCATLSTAEVDLLCRRSPQLELGHKSVLRDDILNEWPIIAVIDGSIGLQQTDLAKYLGLQPETVSRCLRQLDQADIVDVPKPAHIIVKNLPKLKRLANGARP